MLNPNIVISECLEKAFSLKTYIEIMDEGRQGDFTTSQEF